MLQVTAAILIKDNKILIAKRLAGDKLPHKWEFPGGKIETGETPEACLKREMHEEFGIEVRIEHLVVHGVGYKIVRETFPLEPSCCSFMHLRKISTTRGS